MDLGHEKGCAVVDKIGAALLKLLELLFKPLEWTPQLLILGIEEGSAVPGNRGTGARRVEERAFSLCVRCAQGRTLVA